MHKPTQQIALNILTGLILLSHPAANASAQDLSAQVNLDLQAHIQPSKKSVAGPSKLHPLIAQSLKSQKISGSPSPLVVSDEQNKIQVYLKIDALDDSKLETLSGMGVDIDLALDHLNKVQVWAAADAIDELVKVDWVLKITPPNYATPRRGSVTTQGDAILRSNLLRNLGVTGKGIKVGIISDGANNWTSARATGNLPATIQRFGSCQTRANNPSSCLARLTCNEGTAMAEIIHDIAPDAQLAVAGARTSLEFIQRINQLRNTFGADIIVDDLGFFGEPFFADGDIAQAVNSLPASILYFTSAGNSGNSHYQANYNSTISNGVDVHDFGGDDISHGFVVGANSYTLVLVQWAENFDSSASNYDILVSNTSGNLVAGGTFNNIGSTPLEAACVPNLTGNDQVFFAFLNRFSGNARPIKMFFLGARQIEYPMPAESIFGHAGTPKAIAVAAINASDPGNDAAAFYSSRGPSKILFPTPRTRNKPDLAAIDGVSVSGAGGFPTQFFGTSAAAPHAAAVAALLLSANSKITPSQVRSALNQTAIGGRNSSLGYGRINAKAAFDALTKTEGANPAPMLLLLLGDEEE